MDHDKFQTVACPHCSQEFTLDFVAKIPDENLLTIRIGAIEGALLGAETVGEAITGISKTLKAVAKNLGEKVEVFVKEIKLEDGVASVTLATLRKATP